MIPSSEISFQTLTVHGAISSTLLWALSPKKEANFTLLPKQKAPRVRLRLCPNKGRSAGERNSFELESSGVLNRRPGRALSCACHFAFQRMIGNLLWEQTECQTALPSIQMLPTTADGYTLRFFPGFQDFISPHRSCQNALHDVPSLQKSRCFQESLAGCSQAFRFFAAVSLQQVISVNDCSCFLDDVWKWPYCPHTAQLFKTPSIWPDRSKTRAAPGM